MESVHERETVLASTEMSEDERSNRSSEITVSEDEKSNVSEITEGDNHPESTDRNMKSKRVDIKGNELKNVKRKQRALVKKKSTILR